MIQKFFEEQVPSTSHSVFSYDAQTVMNKFVDGQKTVMVVVGGVVKFSKDRKALPFQQNFLLTASNDVWKVVSDVYRHQL